MDNMSMDNMCMDNMCMDLCVWIYVYEESALLYAQIHTERERDVGRRLLTYTHTCKLIYGRHMSS